MGFATVDILWGILSSLNASALLYIDTIFYFIIMTFSVLLWVHYVVSYLDPRNRFGRILVYAANVLFALEILILIVNFFTPVLFYYDNEFDYVPGVARYFTFGVLFLMFLSTSIHAYIISSRTTGKEIIHNRTVAFSGFALSLFMFFQIIYTDFPFYTVGCLIATTLIHVFIEEDERKIFNKEKRNLQPHCRFPG
ncbi:MAG: hypothetical protein J5537_00965 [Lachnospiraceae bacterium]|nr:hypothetical protein [Lachnospiraceae bacterium]